MTEAELLARLKRRRVEVDLTTPAATPLKAITIYGRCLSALRAAGVPAAEREAFAGAATGRARATARQAEQYDQAIADLLNTYNDAELLRVAAEYLVVRLNWKPER